MRSVAIALLLAIILPAASGAADGPIPVALAQRDGGWVLLRDGKPWPVRGAGGGASLELLAGLGANTERTWGVGKETRAYLDAAHRAGLAVVVGIWLGHERHGFDWSNTQQVAKQFATATAAVTELKDHPAVLAWGLGNEMEGYQDGGNEAIWKGIQELAKAVHAIDPRHPTMTTVAEIGGKRVPMIHALCPDIDIVGINSYGGAPSLPERYRKAGGTKPYLVTEYGPPGTWEIPRNALGAVDEPTSTAKGAAYRKTAEILAGDRALSLGSIAFTWGAKIEATSTWFGMLLPDGTRLEACDQLSELWTGKPVANRCPRVEPLAVQGERVVKPGAVVDVTLAASDPEGDALTVEWLVVQEALQYDTGGDAQAAPMPFPEAILRGGPAGAQLRMPEGGGIYRVYAFVRDGHGGGAMANATIKVDGPALPPKARKVPLPAAVYSKGEFPYWVPSGMMGDHQAVTLDATSAEQPRSAGGVCLKVVFDQPKGWAGAVWQHPANDWGKLPGGFDLTGATRLTFWARGKAGGEKVKFGVGIIDTTVRWYDTTKAELPVVLTSEWKQYTIDLADRDLARIKSGFYWVIGDHDQPTTFYLDEVRFE
jgi:hypothetical protein